MLLCYTLACALVLSYNAEWFQNISNLADFTELCWVNII